MSWRLFLVVAMVLAALALNPDLITRWWRGK